MNPTALQQFEAELAQVEQRIDEEIADLFPPFSQMVTAQLRHSRPLLRAAVVLATGVAAEDHDALREQRINLAAALEMLHLAINVHIVLGGTVGGDAPNPSLLGSTILAGDYCFSRSASLAVRTGDQRVVEIFSNALKRVSEGHLRRLFDPAGESYHEDLELYLAGVEAATKLARWPASAQGQALRFVEALADQTTSAVGAPQLTHQEDLQRSLSLESLEQRQRWFAFLNWKAAQPSTQQP
jgi:octaprenyl-diphosphate synthase